MFGMNQIGSTNSPNNLYSNATFGYSTYGINQNMQYLAPAVAQPDEGLERMKTLCKKLSKLQESAALSDFTIKVGAEEFKVHKFVLIMHSTVFEAMFSNAECKESQTNTLDVVDFGSGAIKDFVHYIYTGEVKSNENASDLFQLADQYDIEDLKSLSEEIIVKNLDDSNAFKIFQLGFMHSSEKMKTKAFKYIQEKIYPGKSLKGLLNDPKKISELIRAKEDHDAVLSRLAE